MTEEKRKEGILKRYKDLPKGVVKYIDFLITKINKLVSENTRFAKHILELLKDKGDLTDQIADIKANCDLAMEGRDVKIQELEEQIEKYKQDEIDLILSNSSARAELEQKLEQTEKDLAYYQFNYQTIKDLEKENSDLIGVINNQDVKITDLEKENAELTENYRKRGDIIISLERQLRLNIHSDNLTKAKGLLYEFMRISVASVEEYEPEFSELIGKAEQFLKEIEK